MLDSCKWKKGTKLLGMWPASLLVCTPIWNTTWKSIFRKKKQATKFIYPNCLNESISHFYKLQCSNSNLQNLNEIRVDLRAPVSHANAELGVHKNLYKFVQEPADHPLFSEANKVNISK